jgi:hypothetical protein
MNASNSTLVQDMAIAELSPQTVDALCRLDSHWFSSFRFSTVYNGCDRVRFWTDDSKSIIRAFYYDARTRGYVTIYGPVDVTTEDVTQLLHERNVSFAQLWRMKTPNLLGKTPARYKPKARPVRLNVIDLPESPQAYLASLGKKTRKHLPYYIRRLKKVYSDLYVDFLAKGYITLEILQELVSLNRARMLMKGIPHSGWSDDSLRRSWKAAQDAGFVCCLRHDGKIVGGTLSYLHGSIAYLILIGHDPRFDDLNLGNVSLWLTIQRLIEMGLKQLNLMWAGGFYKKQFGGRVETMFNVVVCRGVAGIVRYAVFRTWQTLRKGISICAEAVQGRLSFPVLVRIIVSHLFGRR